MNYVHIDHHERAIRGNRIPVALQHVFLSSNRGNDVHVPPPRQVSNKMFFRGWLGRTFSTESKSTNPNLRGRLGRSQSSSTGNVDEAGGETKLANQESGKVLHSVAKQALKPDAISERDHASAQNPMDIKSATVRKPKEKKKKKVSLNAIQKSTNSLHNN